MSLRQLLRPSSIAVIGATSSSFVGEVALRNCAALGFAGVVTPIHPHRSEVCGIPAHRSIGDLPQPPDVALVQLSTRHVLHAVRDAVAAGVSNFVIPGGGTTDSGAVAELLTSELRGMRAGGIRVVGPNCMGVVDLVTGAAPYIGTVPLEHLRRGSVAVLAQSGAVAELVVNAGGRVPVSTVVSTGAETTTPLSDYLDFFTEDTETRSVLAFIETMDDPIALMAAIRRFTSAGKRIAVTLVGRSRASQEGIAAHSGKLAGSHRVATAGLSQAGAMIASDLDELLSFGEIFGTERQVRGSRAFVVTNSGGEGNLLTDLAEDAGLVLPAAGSRLTDELHASWPDFVVRNPLDPWGVDAYDTVYPKAIRAAVELGPEADIVIVSQDQQRTSGEHEQSLGRDLATYLARAVDGTACVPVLLSPTSQDPSPAIVDECRAHNIVHLRGATPALRALGAVARAATATSTDESRVIPADTRRLAPSSSLTEDDTLTLLASLGVDTPSRMVVGSPREVAAATTWLQPPFVVKGMAPQLWHKTELGLVRLGLATASDACAAGEEILAAGEAAGLYLSLMVSETIRGTLEVYVGYQRDPQFGHTLIAGLGGVWTELLDSVDIYVGLLDSAAALDWLTTTRVGAMLAQSREGRLDIDGVARAIGAVSSLVAGCDDITAIDLNPLMVTTRSATAVDAVIHRVTDHTYERPVHV